MIDFGKNLIEGEEVLLDEEFDNNSVVKLVRKYKLFGLVESDSEQWEVMLSRLTKIKNENKN